MQHSDSRRRAGRRVRKARTGLALATAAALATATGCGSGKQIVVEDREPVTNYGAGATILMPGQTVPMNGPGGGPGGSLRGPGTGNVSFIGGAYQDIIDEQTTNQNLGAEAVGSGARANPGDTPTWVKVIGAPFIILSYPFVKLAEVMGSGASEVRSSSSTGGSSQSSSGAPTEWESRRAADTAGNAAQPGAAPQAPQTPPAPRDRNLVMEGAELDAMERELQSRTPAPVAGDASASAGVAMPGEQPAGEAPLPWQQTAPAPPPAQVTASAPPPPAPPGRSRSIAEELAALQATIAPRPRAEQTAASPSGTPAVPTSTGLADRVRDRDGNGMPDLWSYHDEAGRPTRELLDEDGDGAPDRTVWFDPETGTELRVEEDTNLDGRIDSWVEFRRGAVARQRRDQDFDGHLDTWSFYEGGELARQEQDTSGDGFRNRVAFYDAGRIVREREDRDGDGSVDAVTLYDDQERPTRRDEDTDGDGRIDVRSIYEGGRLVRRELVETPADDATETLNETAWSEGDAE